MHPDFWHERWQRNEIGFHQAKPHPGLARLWPSLGLPAGSLVFVPLAGKSLDLIWLRDAGHRVLGIELSPLAVRAFFEENGLEPATTRLAPRLQVHRAGAIELIEGDVFDLQPAHLAGVAGVFDRAALVALPPPMRARYVAQLAALTAPGARTLLVTMEYDQAEMPGPPHAVLPEEVRTLYGAAHEIELLARDAALADFPKFAQRGVSALSEAYWKLTRR